MGLLDNIKNYVTGVAAEVTLELTPQQVNRGQNINFKVTVKAQEDLLIKPYLSLLKQRNLPPQQPYCTRMK